MLSTKRIIQIGLLLVVLSLVGYGCITLSYVTMLQQYDSQEELLWSMSGPDHQPDHPYHEAKSSPNIAPQEELVVDTLTYSIPYAYLTDEHLCLFINVRAGDETMRRIVDVDADVSNNYGRVLSPLPFNTVANDEEVSWMECHERRTETATSWTISIGTATQREGDMAAEFVIQAEQ